jgi:hypothetical protein
MVLISKEKCLTKPLDLKGAMATIGLSLGHIEVGIIVDWRNKKLS